MSDTLERIQSALAAADSAALAGELERQQQARRIAELEGQVDLLAQRLADAEQRAEDAIQGLLSEGLLDMLDGDSPMDSYLSALIRRCEG